MASRPVRIFFSAGEPSGDLHAANLIRQLGERSAGFEAVGYGGPEMAAAGCRLHADLTRLAVMWLARALANLPQFWDLVSRADRYFRHQRPDAVVLVDYPGFNWWIARRAKAHGIPVFYYMPPQIWAWARWRVKKMRRLVDRVLCCLPLEEAWFRARGCQATLVGHPFFDELRRRRLDERFLADQRSRGGPLVTILPGSRTQEVANNFHWFLKAAAAVWRAAPQTRFAVAAFKPQQAEMARRLALASGQWAVGSGQWAEGRGQRAEGRGQRAEGSGQKKELGTEYSVPSTRLPVIDIYTGRTPELMHLADCCMACSGSVSLELLYRAKPTVILYWVNRLAYLVQGFFRKVKYITLVNLLAAGGDLYSEDLTPYDPSQPGADKVLFPEYLTCEDKSEQIARHVIQWLTEPEKRAQRVAALERLRAEVDRPGASGRAAEEVLKGLGVRD